MKKITALVVLLIVISITSFAQTSAPVTTKMVKAVSNALEFDGMDDYVAIPNGTGIFAGLNSFSMCGWVYPENGNCVWPDFDGYFGIKNEGICDFYIVQLNGTNLEIRITTNAGQSSINSGSTTQVAPNEWQHMAVTYDGEQLRFYYNGVLDASVNASGTIDYPNYEVTIGSLDYLDTDFYMDGKVDEVSFWNKALSQAEIQEYQCISGDPSLVDNLIAYYNFNQTEGLELPDYFGNYNGNLVNMTGNEWIESEVCESGFDILFMVTDELTLNPVEGAEVNLSGNVKLTNESGEALYSNYDPGVYPYEVTNDEYYDASGQVVITDVDVTEEVIFSPIVYYDITYLVTENPGGDPIDSALVNMGGIIHYTDETGQTTFSGFLPGSYSYTVLKEGYFLVQGTAEVDDENLLVEIELLINHIPDQITTPAWQAFISNGFLVLKNEAKSSSNHEVSIFSATGQLVFKKQINSSQPARISLSSFKNGLYLVQIVNDSRIYTAKVMVTK